MTPRSLARACAAPLASTLLVALALACGDLKSADDAADASTSDDASSSSDGSASNDASTASEAAPDSAASLTGPGPHGSLPTGYCCTSDKDCRYRHCVDPGAGGRMCLDECSQDVFCTRPDLSFTCGPQGVGPRLCAPPAGFTCKDPSTFTRGTRQPGECCNATAAPNNDGTAGSACEGNQCAATGSGPLVCTHRCDFQSDCPDDLACVLFGTSKACVPRSSSYSCK